MEVRGREEASAAVKKSRRQFTPDHPAVYIRKFYYLEYPGPGLEYPDSPETPGHRPETPVLPDIEQIKYQENLI